MREQFEIGVKMIFWPMLRLQEQNGRQKNVNEGFPGILETKNIVLSNLERLRIFLFSHIFHLSLQYVGYPTYKQLIVIDNEMGYPIKSCSFDQMEIVVSMFL